MSAPFDSAGSFGRAPRPARQRPSSRKGPKTPPDPSECIGEVVTQIKRSIRDPSRITIKCGRRVVGTLDEVSAHRLKLKVGLVIDEPLAAAIAERAAADRLRSMALRRIARSMCSVKGLVDSLVRKGAARQDATRVARDLERLGLVSDETFAHAKARSILARKPAGARLIQSKLRAAGVDDARAKAATSGVLVGRDALEDAVALARRRARSIRPGTDPSKARLRVMGALARRGFEMDVVRRAVETVMGKQSRARTEPRPSRG